MNYYDEVNSYVKKVEIGKAIRETNANRGISRVLLECRKVDSGSSRWKGES